MAVGYAACGLPDDALRMVDLIEKTVEENEVRKRGISQTLQRIAQEHLKRGDFEAAVSVARQVGWNKFTATTLANQAVGEVRQGVNASETIAEALSVIEGAKYTDVYEDIYPLLALAMEKSGRTEDARNLFRTIRAEIDDMVRFDKPFVGFELAKAVDEAGYESTDLFKQAFGWADQWSIDEPQLERTYGLSWAMYEHGIRALIERGHFTLAKEYIDTYPDRKWDRSRLISELALEEVKRGLSEAEMQTLSSAELSQMLTDSERTKQAASYFGLGLR